MGSSARPSLPVRTVADRPWKAEERHAARLPGGRRYPANTGGRMDVEGPTVVAQVKHGIVVVKRRAGTGRPTPRLIVLTEHAWRSLQAPNDDRGLPRSPAVDTYRSGGTPRGSIGHGEGGGPAARVQRGRGAEVGLPAPVARRQGGPPDAAPATRP